MRRRRRGPRRVITDEERKEVRRRHRNKMARLRRENKRRKKFVEEYTKICKKYRCCATLMHSPCVWYVRRGEEIYTLKSHFESIRRSLKLEMVT